MDDKERTPEQNRLAIAKLKKKYLDFITKAGYKYKLKFANSENGLTSKVTIYLLKVSSRLPWFFARHTLVTTVNVIEFNKHITANNTVDIWSSVFNSISRDRDVHNIIEAGDEKANIKAIRAHASYI